MYSYMPLSELQSFCRIFHLSGGVLNMFKSQKPAVNELNTFHRHPVNTNDTERFSFPPPIQASGRIWDHELQVLHATQGT